MKKILLNWRYYVMFALFSVGMLALLIVFGDPAENMTFFRESMIRLCALCVCVACFYVLYLCVNYWEAKDLIPEFTRDDEDLDNDLWE